MLSTSELAIQEAVEKNDRALFDSLFITAVANNDQRAVRFAVRIDYTLLSKTFTYEDRIVDAKTLATERRHLTLHAYLVEETLNDGTISAGEYRRRSPWLNSAAPSSGKEKSCSLI